MKKTVIKPWGKEEWLELNEKYCYKRIYINAGYKTSYQYHNFKRETNYIISGEAEVWLENDEGVVEKKLMKAGDFFNVTPPKKHRVIAITDIILQEVSTPEVDDVIRIEDDTMRPDGKIDAEHSNPAVLILCAGLGSRLKNLTKHINKTLLPLNNEAILSHIIKKFPAIYDFIIAIGYKGESIVEYCNLTFPEHKFTFVNVDNYDGIGSGPGYSALQCKEHLQRPFYFITGDCIIDSQIPHLDGNWLGVSTTSYPEKYSTVLVDSLNNIKSFTNKGENGHDLAFIGLGGIYNYENFWLELQKNIKDGEIVSAFEQPGNYPNFKIKKLKWFDTGNLDDLENTKNHYKDKPLSLVKDTGDINYNVSGKFIKFIPNKALLNKKVLRSNTLKNIIPKNFGHGDYFMFYDWVKGNTLYEYDSLKIFNDFLDVLKNNIKDIRDTNPTDIDKFYKEKTFARLDSFIQKNGLSYYKNPYSINGKETPALETILMNINFSGFYDNPSYPLFHGDLQFDNVLYSLDENKFYYIDWRESFGDNVEAGDVYYDLAKLYGGLLIPYNTMKNEETLKYAEGIHTVNFSYEMSNNLIIFIKTYENWLTLNGFDLNKVKVITGLIFLNMSPLHSEKFGKMLWFKAMEILNKNDK